MYLHAVTPLPPSRAHASLIYARARACVRACEWCYLILRLRLLKITDTCNYRSCTNVEARVAITRVCLQWYVVPCVAVPVRYGYCDRYLWTLPRTSTLTRAVRIVWVYRVIKWHHTQDSYNTASVILHKLSVNTILEHVWHNINHIHSTSFTLQLEKQLQLTRGQLG